MSKNRFLPSNQSATEKNIETKILTLELILIIVGHLNSKQIPLEASFSPDSQFVISGSSDGRIHIWNSENGMKICVLNGDHKGPVQCVQVSEVKNTPIYRSLCGLLVGWLKVDPFLVRLKID